MKNILLPRERAAVDVLNALIGSYGDSKEDQVIRTALCCGRNAILRAAMLRRRNEQQCDCVEQLWDELNEAKVRLWEPCPRCGQRKEVEP